MISDGTPDYSFRSNYLHLPGYRLHYIDEGRGAPLLMLHGNPTWSFLYRRFVSSLRDNYRVIVPDHAGCGLSDRPAETSYRYTLASRVTDLEALVQELAPDRPLTLFLHDWGGLIGTAYAARHPGRIGRLVVFNTAGFLLPASKRLHWILRFCRDSRLAAFLILQSNAFARVAVRVGCTSKPLPKAVRNAYVKACDTAEGRRTTLRFIQDIPLSPADPAYPLVQCAGKALASLDQIPVLICWGERDFIFDLAFLEEWTRRLPQAEVHRFPAAGHYVLEECFEAILPLVRDFLAQHTLP